MRLILSATMLILLVAVAPGAIAQDDATSPLCSALQGAIDHLTEYAGGEASPVRLREKKEFVDVFTINKNSQLRRPRAMSRADWRAYDRIPITSRPSSCIAANDEKYGFDFVSEGADGSIFKVFDPRMRADGQAFLMRIIIQNRTEAPDSNIGSIMSTVVVENIDGAWDGKSLQMFRTFRSGRDNKAVVIMDCRNPDDLNDCKRDVQFVR